MITDVTVAVDHEFKTAYITFAKAVVHKTIAVSDCVNLDVSESGMAIGLELLELGKPLPIETLVGEYHLDPELLSKLDSGFFA